MCGICGIVAREPGRPVERGDVQRMCDAIRHRGPDDEGILLDAEAGIGMRRLSIIDLSGGHQPVYNEARTAAVVFNGEIYNYKELVTLLEKRGHHFTTHSDTEVIVHGYEEWGDDLPTHLHGMFAFAIWDRTRRKLFIARDRLGKKPLYYCADDRRLVFGSEIKSLLCVNAGCRTINQRALSAYLSLGYVPGPDTLFTNIHKLPAGHSLTLIDGKLSIQSYWSLSFADDRMPFTLPDSCARVTELLTDAVRVRLMSDVPLGAFLSGGIDSSLVVALMSRLTGQPVTTFSVGFDEFDRNELPYARAVAQHFRTTHHEINVAGCDPALVERLIWHFDEPVADPAAVPTLMLSELARRHVTVVLTGEGGDELFAGYDYYRPAWPQAFRLAQVPLRRQLLPRLGRTVNALLRRQRYHARTLWRWSLPPERQLLASVGIFTDDERARLLTPPFRAELAADVAGAAMARYYHGAGSRDELHRLMYVDTKLWLTDDLLMKVDKMSMAHSLEARTPYLDHRLVEFMATVPARLKISGLTPKRILKEVAKSILPDSIVNRRKQTFDVPIAVWLGRDLRELTRDVIGQGYVGGAQVFDPRYVDDELWPRVTAGDRGAARQLWSLLNVSLWARQFGATIA